MAKLTGQTIAASYDQLLIVGDADGISSSLQAVESADTGGSSSALSISTTAAKVTGAFSVDQDANAVAIDIDSESTSANILDIQAGALQTGAGMRIFSDSSHAGSRNLLLVINDDASATGTTGIMVQQNAAAVGLKIDQNTDSTALLIDSEATSANVLNLASAATTTGNIINLNACDDLTTGRAIYVDSNSSSNGTRNLVEIINNNTGATGTTGLRLVQDAAATALSIDHNANGIGINIDSEATTQPAVQVIADVLTTGSAAYFYSDSADNSTRNLVKIVNDHTSADNAVGLYIQQDGADASIELAGGGGGGIKFSADIDSSDSETLDDYEEGTQVVSLGMSSGSLSLLGSKNEGQYTKIGRIVHYSGEISCNGSSSQSGTLTLTLPFTVADISDLAERTVGTCSLQNCNFTDTFDMLHVNTYAGQNVMTITAVTDNAGWNNLDASTWISGTELVWSISYIAA